MEKKVGEAISESTHPDPPPGSAYHDLPLPLRETIVRSFVDRINGAPGASLNLMFGFGGPTPKTAWEALARLGPMAVNLLVQLYRRIERIDETLTTWRQIRYIRNQWWGGSAGIKVVYWDPRAMRFTLDGLLSGRHGVRVARDTYVGSLDHQLSSSISLLPRALVPFAEPPDADTWREFDMPRQESVHFCVGKTDLAGFEREGERPAQLDDIHIDWYCPVERIDAETGRCNYLEPWEGSLLHWYQAHHGYEAPAFTFQLIDQAIAEANERIEKNPSSGEARRLLEFATRWENVKWHLAVQGKPGYEASRPWMDEVSEILTAVSG